MASKSRAPPPPPAAAPPPSIMSFSNIVSDEDEFSSDSYGREREELSPLRRRPAVDMFSHTTTTTQSSSSASYSSSPVYGSPSHASQQDNSDFEFEGGRERDNILPPASATTPSPPQQQHHQQPQQIREDHKNSQGNESSHNLSAVKLIAVSPEGHFEMTSEGKKVLGNLPEHLPCNLVFIFGNARSGKSFLMNRLLSCSSVYTHPFKVINSAMPCTKGADIISSVLPVNTIMNTRKRRQFSSLEEATEALVGFVDVEGQGDAGERHDTLLTLPLLLTSKVVLFNHKGAPTVSHMLERLGVLARAAQKVRSGIESLDEEEEDGSDEDDDEAKNAVQATKPKMFGHLHIVFRDFSFDGDENTALAQILNDESVPRVQKTIGKSYDPSEAARDRNEIRRLIKINFESVSAWIFPQPASPDILKENAELPSDMISEAFQTVTQRLFDKILSQISNETRLFNEQILDGPKISDLLALLTETVNNNNIVDVPSVFRAMEQQRLNTAEAKAIESYNIEIKQLEQTRLPMSEINLSKELDKLSDNMLKIFDEMCIHTSLIAEAQTQREKLQKHASVESTNVEKKNSTQGWQLVDTALQTEAARLRDEFAKWVSDKMGASNEELSHAYEKLKHAQRERVATALQSVAQVLSSPEFKHRQQAADEKPDSFFSIKLAQNTSYLLDLQAKAIAEEAKRKEAELTAQHMALLEQVNLIQEENAAKLAEMNQRETEAHRQKDVALQKVSERDAQLADTTEQLNKKALLAKETEQQLQRKREELEVTLKDKEMKERLAKEEKERIMKAAQDEKERLELEASRMAEEAERKRIQMEKEHDALRIHAQQQQAQSAAELAETQEREARALQAKAEVEQVRVEQEHTLQEKQQDLVKLTHDIEEERKHKEELAHNLAETERRANEKQVESERLAKEARRRAEEEEEQRKSLEAKNEALRASVQKAQELQEEVRLREILANQQKEELERLAKEREQQLKEKSELLLQILGESEAKERKEKEEQAKQSEQAFITHKEGWLLKKAQGKVRNWKRRYFRCEGGVLAYYVDQDCAVKKGFIGVLKDTVIQRVDVRTLKTPAKKAKYKYAFNIISNDRTLMCRPDDDSAQAAQTVAEWEAYLTYVAKGLSRDSAIGGTPPALRKSIATK